MQPIGAYEFMWRIEGLSKTDKTLADAEVDLVGVDSYAPLRQLVRRGNTLLLLRAFNQLRCARVRSGLLVLPPQRGDGEQQARNLSAALVLEGRGVQRFIRAL